MQSQSDSCTTSDLDSTEYNPVQMCCNIYENNSAIKLQIAILLKECNAAIRLI